MTNKYLYKLAQTLKEPARPESIGIDLTKGDEKELYKWLIAVTLYSKPIQRSVASRTSQQLALEGLTSPEAIQKAGWVEMTHALGRGHYSRFDESMSTNLIAQAKHLQETHGTLKNLIDNKTPEEIRKEIESFRGIGPLGSKLFIQGLGSNLEKYRDTK